MKITELIKRKSKDLNGEKIPTIVFLGDSVTQGCFDLYVKKDRTYETYFDKNSAYHNYLAKLLTVLYPNVPVNIINAGISGATAKGSLARVERDVLAYSPDLAVVCFGLNDCMNGSEEDYYNSLKEIFSALLEKGVETIFMTPSMMATEISCHLKDKELIEVAGYTVEKQTNGSVDRFVEIGKRAATESGVIICDVYKKWKILEKNGVDITEMLANKINHPTEKMNWIFAYSLLETIMMS